MDTLSKSDPFCVLYKKVPLQKNSGPGQYLEIGKTEVIHDNLNPEFVKKMLVDFHFEQKDEFKIDVYDSDNQSQQTTNLSQHDYIGSLEFTLHEVVTARD